MTTIKAAALRLKDGTIIFKPPPARHASLYLTCDVNIYAYGTEGFLTSEGEFVDRDRAYVIAKHANQLIIRDDVPATTGTLYTEDLW